MANYTGRTKNETSLLVLGSFWARIREKKSWAKKRTTNFVIIFKRNRRFQPDEGRRGKSKVIGSILDLSLRNLYASPFQTYPKTFLRIRKINYRFFGAHNPIFVKSRMRLMALAFKPQNCGYILLKSTDRAYTVWTSWLGARLMW